MKKYILSILMIVLYYQLNAQAIISPPTFTREIVTMKVFSSAIINSYISVSDGTQTYVVNIERMANNAEKEKSNNSLSSLSLILNRLKEQKYEVLTASAATIGDVILTTYVLQKKE